MVFNAKHAQKSMYAIGFKPALKIDDTELWVDTDRGLYAALWWIGDDPVCSPILQSEHVSFFLNENRKVEAVLEPGVMRMYLGPEHELWTIAADMDEEEDDYGDEAY